jgi:hypothetical protein
MLVIATCRRRAECLSRVFSASRADPAIQHARSPEGAVCSSDVRLHSLSRIDDKVKAVDKHPAGDILALQGRQLKRWDKRRDRYESMVLAGWAGSSVAWNGPRRTIMVAGLLSLPVS